MRFSVNPARFIPFILVLAALPTLASPSLATVLKSDTVWKGEVILKEDVLVPAGVTLTIVAGTTIKVAKSESSRTDPEYLSPLTEITIRGVLRAEGTPEAPIVFSAEGNKRSDRWAGILVDGGKAFLRNCRVEDANTAVLLSEGSLDLHDNLLSHNRYGLVLQEEQAGAVQGEGNRIEGNDYGLIAFGDVPLPAAIARITHNRKRDTFVILPHNYPLAEETGSAPKASKQPVSRRYGDKVLNGETVWRGRVEVNGLVRVPEGSRLVILPGTVVEFGKKDTNGDGIGENGLLIQGVIIAKGTPSAPITFRSLGGKGRGSWDAINILGSDGPWNLIEYCRIEDAYRGLHFHFARAAVTHSVINGNYRGIQFQESTVLIRDNRIFANKSAVQCRDSDVTFEDNSVHDNWQGVNFFRDNLFARGNKIVANGEEGVRIREGTTVFKKNLVDSNRFGLLVLDAYYGTFAGNCISNNGEVGLSLKDSDNMKISGNFVSGNGINGMNIQDSGGHISGNLVADNGERGVGIQSFSGTLERNNFSNNGLYALDLEGSDSVAAPRNWWGDETPDKTIYDRKDDPTKGQVKDGDPARSPFLFSWPLVTVETALTWRGDIAVGETVTVLPGATLTVAPRTRVLFAKGAGLTIHGRLLAQGEVKKEVVFTSLKGKEAGAWNEILLEHANGSTLAHCLIEYATWGVHSHFTRLAVTDTVLRRNYGGMRFRSGPLTVERTLITQNTIGLRDFRGNATVRNCAITGNETGVFVREKGGGLTLTEDNIFSNSRYNLRLGDFNDEDVPASGNWWGEVDPLTTIYDARQMPGIGMARIEPYLSTPLHLALPEGVEP